MRLPNNFLGETVNIVRRSTTGAGKQDVVVAQNVRCKVEEHVKTTQDSTGTQTKNITTIYTRESNIQEGDRVIFGNGKNLEIRSFSRVFSPNGQHLVMVKAVAW